MPIKLYDTEPINVESEPARVRDPNSMFPAPWEPPPPPPQPFVDTESRVKVEAAVMPAFRDYPMRSGYSQDPRPVAVDNDSNEMLRTPKGFESKWNADEPATAKPFALKR